MTIDVASDVEAFLREQVRAGVCSDPSALVNYLIRSLHEQQQRPWEITPELEAWLLESANQPTTLLTAQDFEALRDRVRARMSLVAWELRSAAAD